MVDHLLVHCSKAKLLWDVLLAIIGVKWVFPLSVRKTLLTRGGSFVGKKRKKLGWQPHLVFFGLFGAKGTTLHLTTKSSQLK